MGNELCRTFPVWCFKTTPGGAISPLPPFFFRRLLVRACWAGYLPIFSAFRIIGRFGRGWKIVIWTTGWLLRSAIFLFILEKLWFSRGAFSLRTSNTFFATGNDAVTEVTHHFYLLYIHCSPWTSSPSPLPIHPLWKISLVPLSTQTSILRRVLYLNCWQLVESARSIFGQSIFQVVISSILE